MRAVMLILTFLIVVESRLTGGKYECFDCMLTIENNKTVEQRGGPCLEPSVYEEPLTDRMHKGENKVAGETLSLLNKVKYDKLSSNTIMI